MAAGTKAKAAEASKGNGRADIDAAHRALGTEPGEVPGVDLGPQDVHDGDGLDAGGGEPVVAQLSFAVGGKKPTSTALTLVGGKIEVGESFQKGQRIRLEIVAEVGEVAFVDQRDAKTGQVIGCERKHKARILSVMVA